MPRFACLGSVQGVRGKEVGAVRARLSRRVREDEELGERNGEKAFFSSCQCYWR